MQNSCKTREELVGRLRFLNPVFSFRQKSEYQNQVYIALGNVIEQLYEKSYEALIEEKIANPLGIEIRFRGFADEDERLTIPYNIEFSPSAITQSRLERNTVGFDNPCGGLILTNDGLERWLRFVINEGELEGVKLISDKSFETWIKPVSTYEVFGEDSVLRAYALGWVTEVFAGKLLVSHGGVQTGYQSDIAFFPKEKSGVSVVTNCLGIPIGNIIKQIVLDVLTGQVKPDYEGYFLQKYMEMMQPQAETEVHKTTTSYIPGSELGSYFDEGYGCMEIIAKNDGLSMHYYSVDYPLTHVTGNCYSATHALGMKLTLMFEPDMFANVSSVTLKVDAGSTAVAVFKKKGNRI
jgi:CubicO group peptidase (beta-lactamase class C family)